MKSFTQFYKDMYGYEPFPWQAEAARCLVDGEPLDAVVTPTGSGKTALIDAAVFAAAHGGARRIAFIIDRRVVVDEAHERALLLRDKLEGQKTPVLAEIADALSHPLQVVRLRGGVFVDDDWVRYPERPTVLISTVDQVGSRLLFRGYGVSPRMAPVHAGFVGVDALYIVDEAHLSTPFVDTVRAAKKLGAGVRLVVMSATPPAGSTASVALTEADRGHPVLSRRLAASKAARLVAAEKGDKAFEKLIIEHGEALADEVKTLGVVVNRVATARAVWNALSRHHNAVLLTGRTRPYDRDRLVAEVAPHVKVGRDRQQAQSLIVVATQTIEVGADYDFDALVTESAPLSELQQRFGRLDRLGELGQTQSVIVHRMPPTRGDSVDPVYKEALGEAWEWFNTIAKNREIDMGVMAMEQTVAAHKPPVRTLPRGPVLLPAHLDLLGQTGPGAPHVDVAPWLHGAGSASADVSVIWRADLDTQHPEQWSEIVRLRSPLSREAIELPIYAVRAWISEKTAPDVADVEGVEQEVRLPPSTRQVLRWRGPEDTELVHAEALRPGDTVVVPSSWGGCDCYGWDPKSKAPVEDIADAASAERGREHAVRLVPGLTSWLGKHEDDVLVAVCELVAAETTVDAEIGIDQERVDEAHAALRSLLKDITHPLLTPLGPRYTIERHPKGVVLRGRTLIDARGTLTGGVRVLLDDHLSGVAAWVDRLANGHDHQEAIRRSGALHDLGKSERRFKVMLYGDELEAAAGPALAKSGMRRRSDIEAAYRLSGLPRGFRHEMASIAMSDEENELVRYLIGTHHGYGRPWIPVCEDSNAPGAQFARLDGGWLMTYLSIIREHGPWQTANMEMLLRNADARRSMEEQEGG